MSVLSTTPSRRLATLLLSAAAASTLAACAPEVDRSWRFDIVEATIPEMQAALAEGIVDGVVLWRTDPGSVVLP